MNVISDLKSIVGVSSTIITVRVAGILLALVWMILVTRNIEANHVGQMIIGMSISNLLAIFASLNMGAVAIKFIPSYITKNKIRHIKGYIKSGNYFVIIFATIITIFALCIYSLQLYISVEIIPKYILLSLLSAPLLGWIQLHASYIHAHERVLLSVIPAYFLQPITMLLLIWIGIVLELISNAEQLMLAYLFALLIIFFVQEAFFRNTLNQKTAIRADYTEKASWLIQALQLIVPFLFIQNAAQMIIVFSTGALTKEEIAVLGVILRIMTLLLFSVGAITMASSHRLSKEVHKKNSSAVAHTLTISGFIKLILSVLGCFFVFAFGDYILAFFGQQYTVGYTALLILSFVPIVTAVFGPVVLFVTLLNFHFYSLVVFLISIILLAILIVVLGGSYGVEGVAYAVFVTWMFWNICLYGVIRIKGGYDLTIFNFLSRQTSTPSR